YSLGKCWFSAFPLARREAVQRHPAPPLVRHSRGCRFVNHTASGEALRREGRIDPMGFIASNRVCKDIRRTGCGLEAAGSPATIDKKSGHWRFADDWRAIGRDINNAAPFAQHAHAREHWENL